MTTISLPASQPARAWQKGRRALWIILGLAAALFGLGWVGLHIQPAPFAPVPEAGTPPETVALPAGLPAPVARFYRQRYGEQVPLIKTAVISGRATVRVDELFNLTFPARLRFTHDAGQSYRHYFELTFFGLPVLKVNEYYVDGKETMVLPWGVQTGAQYDQAGNLGMWAEAINWLPAILLTDPRVRWEPVDEATALLVVPFGEKEERFVVRFDPASGQIQYWETMRSGRLWINGTWFDEGSPWLVIREPETVVNVPVDTSLEAKGLD